MSASYQPSYRFRIAGAVPGDSFDPHNCSGIPTALFETLDRRGLLARRLDVGLSSLQRYRLAATTFHPLRDRWQGRFRQAVYETQSRNCAHLVAGDNRTDVILQVFRGFQARGLPYWLFLDTTDAIRRAGGRETPFGPDGLGYATECELYREADHIFVMASEPRTSLIDDYGVAETAVTVVGAGPNIAYPDRLLGGDDVQRYGRRTVLFVGRHDFERKGGPELLRAWEGIPSEVPGARLVIAGVRLPEDPPGVESLGEVLDRSDLVKLYETATVFCMPSRFEPTGMSIMEAMSYGLPVVGTRVGGIPEAIREGQTGLVVEAGDIDQLRQALIRILDDPHEAARMGKNGRAWIDAERNWDVVVDRMLEAVSGSPAPGSGRPARA